MRQNVCSEVKSIVGRHVVSSLVFTGGKRKVAGCIKKTFLPGERRGGHKRKGRRVEGGNMYMMSILGRDISGHAVNTAKSTREESPSIARRKSKGALQKP